jgi:hypothetical protein
MRELAVMKIATIDPYLAKHWFQVHGVDGDGRIVVRQRFRLLPPLHREGALEMRFRLKVLR